METSSYYKKEPIRTYTHALLFVFSVHMELFRYRQNCSATPIGNHIKHLPYTIITERWPAVDGVGVFESHI